MKVILLKDVAKVGKKYEVKTVSDGFALNMLVPRGMAEAATEKNLKKLDMLKVQDTAERKIQEDLLMKNLKDLSGLTITVKEQANEKGSLFAGLHKEEIIPLIKKESQLDMSADHLVLEKPIKSVGEYDIEVKVQDKSATFKLVVEAA